MLTFTIGGPFGHIARESVSRKGQLQPKGEFILPESPVDLKIFVTVKGVREIFNSIRYILHDDIRRITIFIAGYAIDPSA
jgi:hypothetical protein